MRRKCPPTRLRGAVKEPLPEKGIDVQLLHLFADLIVSCTISTEAGV
jgi:hypothetical protein